MIVRKVKYIMIWWDCYDQPHQSEPMDKEIAEKRLSDMHKGQEASLMLVYVNE